MKRTSHKALIIIATLLAGCSKQTSTTEKASEATTNNSIAMPNGIKAQRLMVWSGGQSLMIAGSSGGSSGGGFVMADRGNGNYGVPSEQLGTTVVYFRDFDKLSPDDLQTMRQLKISPGNAYLKTADGLKLIGKVDSKLTDDQVAALFGVK